MLVSLAIKNIALIEKLSIDFSDKFSVITGETGAGKSILLGALGLVLGKRADISSLKNKEEKCVIEAHFEISNYNLTSFFDENDIDFQSESIIRREILPTGKSRAFVNDTPVNLQQLQELGSLLFDIHSQHQTLEINDENYQFHIIDAVASNQDLIVLFQKNLKEFKQLKSKLSNLIELKNSLNKEKDYNNYLLEELISAQLIPNEQAELESRFETLNNIEFLKENVSKVIAIANEEQIGVKQNLVEIKSSLQKSISFAPIYSSFHERISSILIEFNDLIDEISDVEDTLVDDPEQLELVNQKLQTIYSLQKKHQVNSVEELISIKQNLENEVLSADQIDFEIKELQLNIHTKENELNSTAQKISDNRKIAIPVITSKIESIIKELGMPNAHFKVDLIQTDNFYTNGKDEISFLFSGNKGTDFGLLKKVASGGELSRIMLAVKAILAQYSKLPTILFDEIDTGVSGEIANKMGEIMKEMSNNMQVFAITHLPQIAAKGQQHYKVFKKQINDTTVSEIQLLSYQERISEIAELLSGKSNSESAMILATSLLN